MNKQEFLKSLKPEDAAKLAKFVRDGARLYIREVKGEAYLHIAFKDALDSDGALLSKKVGPQTEIEKLALDSAGQLKL